MSNNKKKFIKSIGLDIVDCFIELLRKLIYSKIKTEKQTNIIIHNLTNLLNFAYK